MKDNRIYRPEQLTEAEKDQFMKGLDSYLEKEHARHEREAAEHQAEIQRRIEAGEIIVKDGKMYDARFYKGDK